MCANARAGTSTATTAMAIATTVPRRRCVAFLAPILPTGPETYRSRSGQVVQTSLARLADLLREAEPDPGCLFSFDRLRRPGAGSGARRERRGTLIRTASLRRGIALALAALTLAFAGLVAGIAAGEGGGKVTVLSSQQHAILDAGAVTVEVKGGSPYKSVLVDGLQGGGGTIQLGGPVALDPGKSADLIAVGGDPLVDPAAVQHVDYVMVKGKPIPMKGQ